jgi:hypothetical protein
MTENPLLSPSAGHFDLGPGMKRIFAGGYSFTGQHAAYQLRRGDTGDG